VKIDRELEAFTIAKASGRLLDPLNLCVQPVGHRVCFVVGDVGEDVLQMAPDDAGHMDHRLKARAKRPGLPALEERARRWDRAIIPDVVERFVHRPRARRLERALTQAAKRAATRGREVLPPDPILQPEILRPGEPSITALSQHTLLAPPYLVHRLDHEPHHVEFIEHDLPLAIRDIVANRLSIRIPHVRGDRLNRRALLDGTAREYPASVSTVRSSATCGTVF
jgi:hypothetical protein